MPVQLPDYDRLPFFEWAPPRSAWGLFGSEDQVGTLNLITDEMRCAAAKLVSKGQAIGVDHDIYTPRTAFFAHRTEPTHHFLVRRGGLSRDDYLDGFYPQYSTQWDALAHMRHPVHGFYNGIPDDRVAVRGGALGIDNWAKRGIVGRGVLLDLPPYFLTKGIILAPDRRFSIDTSVLDEVAAMQGVEFRQGDILLIRTGVDSWLRSGASGVAASSVYEGPGLAATEETLRWLWNHHFAAVASDNLSVEVWPPESDETFLHLRALPLLGLAFGELFSLEELALECAGAGSYEFLFVSKPLFIPGGIGSPANAVAIL